MKLLVTGASGFLGQSVVSAAASRGHEVRALVRPASVNVPPAWRHHHRIEVLRKDLRSPRELSGMLEGVDGVIHLAATKGGDLYDQFGGTVIATENLLAAMREAGVPRIVVTSSFAIYEYLHRWSWGCLDEDSPLVCNPESRDEYCQTKLLQEQLVRAAAKENGWRCAVLRPGVIFGRDNLWNGRVGMQIAPRWWVRTGTFAPLPLTYVENCAEAIVKAAEFEGEQREIVLNVVDDETPSQRAYLNELRRHMPKRPRIIPIPWTAMRALARTASLVNSVFFRGTAKVPGLFVPARLHARCKPMRYPNTRIKETLGWEPRYTWREGIVRAMADTAGGESAHPNSSAVGVKPQNAP